MIKVHLERDFGGHHVVHVSRLAAAIVHDGVVYTFVGGGTNVVRYRQVEAVFLDEHEQEIPDAG